MARHVGRSAGFALIETGTLAQFEVTSTHVSPSPDGETSFVRIEMQLGEPGDDDGNGEDNDEVERAAFGFMFVLALLSFNDARPRGDSETQYVEGDELTVADFIAGLRFVRGELHLDLDHLRGRCVKTAIRVRRDGQVSLETWSRGAEENRRCTGRARSRSSSCRRSAASHCTDDRPARTTNTGPTSSAARAIS